MPKLKSLALAALAFALFAVFAGPAAAKDRNHDRIPDRWEKRHHLSLHVDQARRDQDRDGLRNRAEFKARTDPRDADSDNDGVDDGDEHAGTIQSFNATTGVLTVSLFGGGTASGRVTAATEIECDGARSSDHGGDSSGPGGGEQSGSDRDDDHGDDEGAGDDDPSCGTGALTAERRVKEAELRLGSGAATFRKIELAP